MSGITPDRLSEIIGSIYDCVITPDRWAPTLSDIVDELNFATGALSVHDVATGNMRVHVTVGMDQKWIEQTTLHAASVYDLWGGLATWSRAPLEEPIMLSEATPRSSWQGNPYYEAVGRPRGMHDAAAIALVRDSRTFGIVALGQHERDGEIGEPVKSGLRLIAPHLRRAVVIGRLFEQEATAASTFSAVLEVVAAGVVLVDAQMGIVHANATAQAMLKSGDPIQDRGGKVAISNALANSVLVNAVAQAARKELDLERRSIDIPVRRADGTPTVIQVLPLRQRTMVRGLEARTAAAVFISNAADPPRLPADAMALLYNLTPAETRIFELIVEGKTPADISQQLGLSLATVRTHLSRVFEKTGCARQADLVALAAKVTLTV